jgi:hypothetical protein
VYHTSLAYRAILAIAALTLIVVGSQISWPRNRMTLLALGSFVFAYLLFLICSERRLKLLIEEWHSVSTKPGDPHYSVLLARWYEPWVPARARTELSIPSLTNP